MSIKYGLLEYVMENRKSRSFLKRLLAEIAALILRKDCRQQERRLKRKRITLTPPKYTAKDILRMVKKKSNG